VQFLSRGEGFTLFLAGDRATLELAAGKPGDASSTALFMNLAGARQNATASGEDALPGHSNYLVGNDPAKWKRNLETWRKVRYTGVYPGVDLIYYGTQGRLEYDFVVAPQADTSRIRLRFAGATPVVDASGDLVLAVATDNSPNEIRFRKPVLYQQVQGVRQPVNGKFTIAANKEVGFEVGAYDRTHELVIDPVLAYSSYLGGSTAISEILGMTVNAFGEIYVTGETGALDYPTTPGSVQPTCPETQALKTKCGDYPENSTAFVAKISADGQFLIYSTYLGGSGKGYGVGGSAYSAGGSGNEYGQSIAVDSGDDAWVLGQTYSNNFPVTADAYQLYCSPETSNVGAKNQSTTSTCAAYNGGGEYIFGAPSLFIVQLNPTGTDILYGTFFGGSQAETPAAIALDATGDVYFTGTSATTGGPYSETGQFPYPTTSSAYQTTGPRGGVFAFVTELGPGGKSLLYSTFFGSLTTNTYGQALAVNDGKIFIGGSGQDGIPTSSGALSGTCPAQPGGPHCATNGWVAEFDPTQSGAASLVFATYLNGTSAGGSEFKSNVTALAADAAGNVYVAGTDQYTNFPTTSGVLQTTCAVHNGFCGATAFVTKLSQTGGLLWSTFYGSPSASGQIGSGSPAIALDANNDVYIADSANASGDLPLKNTLETYAGGQAVVAELSNDGKQVLFGTFFGSGNGSNVFPTGIAVDSNMNIYFAGYNAGGGNVPLANAYQTSPGSNPGFFAKILAVTPTSQTITFGILGNQTYGSVPFNVSATASSGLPVSFNSQTPLVCTVSGAQVTMIAGGQCTVQATQAGDTAYPVAMPVNQSFQVTPESQTITIPGPLATQPFGTAPFSISASASATSGLAVSFASATPAVCTMSGSTVMLVAVGSCLIQVTQEGDADYAAAPLVEEGFDVTPNPLRFIAMTPCRVADTRYSNGAFGSPSLVGGATRSFTVPSSSCSVPTTAAAYSLNVTVVPKGPLDYLTVWPGGETQPLVSTLNSVDGRIKANAAIIPAGTDGAVSVYASNTTDVILDIDGYFVPAASDSAALAFYPLTPCRIADTRYFSYGSLGPPSLSAGQTRSFNVLSSTCSVPSTAQAYSLNFTVVPPGTAPVNYITTYPTGATQPLTSTLNDDTGTIVANAAIVPAGTGGAVTVYSYSKTNLLIDINGYFAPPGTGGLSLYNLTPCRVLDSRVPAPSTPPFTGEKDVNVTGSGCGAPASAQAYVFNATVVPPGPMNYLTLWAQGAAQPVVSTLNALDGAITSNMALVPTTNGSISSYVYVPSTTYLILDLFGYLAP
jgi:hypothetical protein